MAKVVTNGIFDAALNVVGGFDRMAFCSAQPADPTGISAVTLAVVTMTGGDFTVADGDTSGRKITIGAKSGVSVTVSGDVNHVALYINASQGAGDNMLVTTAPSRTVANGDTIDSQAFDFEIQDPA